VIWTDNLETDRQTSVIKARWGGQSYRKPCTSTGQEWHASDASPERPRDARIAPPSAGPASPLVFISVRAAPLSAPGFSRMIEWAAVAADLGIKAHAHMLRHACGYKLANDGIDTRSLQAYLGHRNTQHTVRYTELSPDRFKDFSAHASCA
jgi:site-specific recombinase XerD